MSQLLTILLITLIAFIVCIQCDGETANVCDPSKTDPIVLNGSSGSLKIVNIQNLDNKKCEWIINATNNSIHFEIEELILGVNDSIQITTNDSKRTVLYESKGSLFPGVILLDSAQPVVRVVLTASADKLSREWDVAFGTDQSVQLQNIESTGRFVFAYKNDSLDKTADFDIILRTKFNSKKLLINIDKWLVGTGGTVVFNNTEKYGTADTFSDAKKPDFLLSNGQQINIKIKSFKTKSNPNGLQFHYELVDSLCSQYQKLSDLDKNNTFNVKLPNSTDLQTLSSFKCLNVFEHQSQDSKFLLDLSKYEFLNTGDLITVRDGNSFDSNTLAVIEAQFMDSYWRDLYLYSSLNKMWILFESPQVINRDMNVSNTIGVLAQSQGGSFTFDSKTNDTNLVLKKRDSQIPFIYIFNSEIGTQIAIDFDKSPLPGSDFKSFMTIYEGINRNSKPLIDLRSNTYPPDIMASNTNQLKVVFNQNSDFLVPIKKVKSGCHSSVVGTSGTYSLNVCNTLCSWLIPKQDNTSGTYILEFSALNLPKNSNKIFMEQLGTTTSTVFALKGPLTAMTFPELILNSNETYVLYVDCSEEPVNSSELLSASLLYIDRNISNNIMNLSQLNDNTSTIIQTPSYPNYYSVGSDHNWQINGRANQTAFITFTDLDLSAGHQLMFLSPNQLTLFTNNTQLLELSDYFITLPLKLILTSQSLGTIEPFSARGFSAKISPVNCGQAVNVSKSFAVSTPVLTGATKCIWTVRTNNTDKDLNVLEFKLSGGKDFDLKNLQIYDSNSIRTNTTLLFDNFKDGNFSSSTNSLIIIYNIVGDTKNKDLTLNMTFTSTVCPKRCPDNKRCLLPTFICNGYNDCGDFSDEYNCVNGTRPTPDPHPSPAPQPQPIVKVSYGINGWLVFLLIVPIAIGMGVAGSRYGPGLMSRFGRGRYREFQDFSEVS